MSKKSKPTYNPPISMFNWFITLLLSIIPGVNILFFIFGISFAKSPSKRSFCLAALVLALLIIAAVVIASLLEADAIIKWCNDILDKVAPETTPAP